jgi:hypothetical protein
MILSLRIIRGLLGDEVIGKTTDQGYSVLGAASQASAQTIAEGLGLKGHPTVFDHQGPLSAGRQAFATTVAEFLVNGDDIPQRLSVASVFALGDIVLVKIAHGPGL